MCIFRDQSELQTSNNLGQDIKNALLQSRYLIVVCSEQTKDSLWCMEEIRLFKEAHHGSTKNILTLLISGDSKAVLPEELLYEEMPDKQSEEGEEVQKVGVRPLSADVRADSLKKSLSKMKVEFLRIAAPILGCRFDDLYQHKQKRRCSTIHRPGARTGAVIGRDRGIVIAARVCMAYFGRRSERSYFGAGFSSCGVCLCGKPGNRQLSLRGKRRLSDYQCGWTGTEQTAGKLPAFSFGFSDWWVFCDEQDIFFYHPGMEREYTIPIPQESSLIYEETDLFYDELLPAASVLNEERAVAYKGIVHLYSLNGWEGMEELSLKTGVQRYIDYTTGMDISTDNAYFALAYGTEFQGGLANPGGYFEIYSQDGELLFKSECYSKEAFLGIGFHPDQNEYLIVWSASHVHVWDWKEGKEIAGAVREENIRAACITKEGCLLVDNRDDMVSFYSLQKLLTEKNLTMDLNEQDSYEKFMTYYSHLKEFEEVGKLDCGNEEILRVCFGDTWTAVELQSGDILLFGNNGQRIERLIQHVSQKMECFAGA